MRKYDLPLNEIDKDSIFTRVGASDDLASGQSTFMVEMSEVAEILDNATSKSLIILDEIGRGTSTYDGMSIARAVLEFTADKKKLGAKTLFATHYHELTELENVMDGVKNYNIACCVKFTVYFGHAACCGNAIKQGCRRTILFHVDCCARTYIKAQPVNCGVVLPGSLGNSHSTARGIY